MLKSVKKYLETGLSFQAVRLDALVDTLSYHHVKAADNARDYANSLLDAIQQVDDLPVAGMVLRDMLPWVCTRNDRGLFVFKNELKASYADVEIHSTLKSLRVAVAQAVSEKAAMVKQANDSAFDESKMHTWLENTAKNAGKKILANTKKTYQDVCKELRQDFEKGLLSFKPE